MTAQTSCDLRCSLDRNSFRQLGIVAINNSCNFFLFPRTFFCS